MQDTAGAWLMTALTVSPLLIALMQTAASLPVLLLGAVSGATADIFDRRKLLIFWQFWMLVAAIILSVLALTGTITAWQLLGLTFLLNVGAAMAGPVWQAIVPELVPRSELPDAIAINSAGYNLARAVGPALGGLMVAAFAVMQTGAGAVFLLNALSFAAVVWVLYEWKRTPIFKSTLPAERLIGSIRAGVRYVRHSPPLLAIFFRGVLFTTFVSSVWALLPLVAKQEMNQGALGYGILTGCLGAGAVIGAVLIPRIRRRVRPGHIVQSASMIFVGTLLVLAFVKNVPAVFFALLAGGFAWTCTTSTLNIAVQLSVPGWVQARVLGSYQMVFQGGMALGSAFWGLVAEQTSAAFALSVCAGGLLAIQLIAGRFQLPEGDAPDLQPFALNRPTPNVVIEPRPDDGPVLVMVDYRVAPERHAQFIRAVHQMREVRLRDGAFRWGIFRNAADPDRFTETFLVDSWIEYLRQRERLTATDRMLRDHVWELLAEGTQPSISHMIYAREPAGGANE
jgi:MFS family permease